MFLNLSSKFGARSRLTLILLCVTGLLALSACSSSDEGPSASLSDDEQNRQEAGQTAEDVTQDEVLPDEVEPADEDLPVIASQVGSVSGQKVRLDVNALRMNDDGLLELDFMISTLEGEDPFFNHHGAFSEPDPDRINDDYAGIYLLDDVNKKKYLTVLDAADVCLCSEYESFDNQAHLYAMFPPPPEDVTSITVVVPHFQPLSNVEIVR